MTLQSVVQFNPSTLKVSYNAANKKVQMLTAGVCGNCTTPPLYLDAVISTYSNCTCCRPIAPGNYYYSSQVINVLDTYRLMQRQPPTDQCYYWTIPPIEGSYGTIKRWLDAGCTTTLLQTYTLTQLAIRVNLLATRASVEIKVSTGTSSFYLGFGQLDYLGGEDCGDTETDNLGSVCCATPPSSSTSGGAHGYDITVQIERV